MASLARLVESVERVWEREGTVEVRLGSGLLLRVRLRDGMIVGASDYGEVFKLSLGGDAPLSAKYHGPATYGHVSYYVGQRCQAALKQMAAGYLAPSAN